MVCAASGKQEWRWGKNENNENNVKESSAKDTLAGIRTPAARLEGVSANHCTTNVLLRNQHLFMYLNDD